MRSLKKMSKRSLQILKWPFEWMGKTTLKDNNVCTILQIMIIPATIALVGVWFSNQQEEASRKLNNQQYQLSNEIAENQQRDTILRTYMSDISDLLLNHQLLESKPNDKTRVIARARTLATLRALEHNSDIDSRRRGALLQFLHEAQLIDIPSPIISLKGADFQKADLQGDDLSNADLANADLSEASLQGITLSNTNLYYTDLRGANLSKATLSKVQLYGAHFSNTTVNGAVLDNRKFNAVNLTAEDCITQR